MMSGYTIFITRGGVIAILERKLNLIDVQSFGAVRDLREVI